MYIVKHICRRREGDGGREGGREDGIG